MENSYGVGVANRYALFLDDESDPLETIKRKEHEKKLKNQVNGVEKENKEKTEVPAKGKTASAAKRAANYEDNKREGRQPNHERSNDNNHKRFGNKFNNENHEEDHGRNREDGANDGFSSEIGDGRSFKIRGRGRRGGAPRWDFDEQQGEREFDRHSRSEKTGVKPVDKRNGGGAYNWGSNKDVIDEADESWETEKSNTANIDEFLDTEKPDAANIDESLDTEKSDMANVIDELKEPEPEPKATLAYEEPKQLTLDEWKALQAAHVKPQYNIRKAGEGENPRQWKKMYELKKKNEDHEVSEDEYDAGQYPQRVGKQKFLLDINIQFNDNKLGGGGRGRGGRGGRGSRFNRM